mmetsp:Transcript_30222/g.86345  ORF Transcript_30222/g.86345 Transcript_30222/m.86345 type:complete len:412 (-) Transcript_30222:2279-3514(-)
MVGRAGETCHGLPRATTCARRPRGRDARARQETRRAPSPTACRRASSRRADAAPRRSGEPKRRLRRRERDARVPRRRLAARNAARNPRCAWWLENLRFPPHLPHRLLGLTLGEEHVHARRGLPLLWHIMLFLQLRYGGLDLRDVDVHVLHLLGGRPQVPPQAAGDPKGLLRGRRLWVLGEDGAVDALARRHGVVQAPVGLVLRDRPGPRLLRGDLSTRLLSRLVLEAVLPVEPLEVGCALAPLLHLAHAPPEVLRAQQDAGEGLGEHVLPAALHRGLDPVLAVLEEEVDLCARDLRADGLQPVQVDFVFLGLLGPGDHPAAELVVRDPRGQGLQLVDEPERSVPDGVLVRHHRANLVVAVKYHGEHQIEHNQDHDQEERPEPDHHDDAVVACNEVVPLVLALADDLEDVPP